MAATSDNPIKPAIILCFSAPLFARIEALAALPAAVDFWRTRAGVVRVSSSMSAPNAGGIGLGKGELKNLIAPVKVETRTNEPRLHAREGHDDEDR